MKYAQKTLAVALAVTLLLATAPATAQAHGGSYVSPDSWLDWLEVQVDLLLQAVATIMEPEDGGGGNPDPLPGGGG